MNADPAPPRAPALRRCRPSAGAAGCRDAAPAAAPAPRWIYLLAILSIWVGGSAHAAPPQRLVLIDFESDGDAARLREIRDTCPQATNGRAHFRIVADDAAAPRRRVLRLDYALAAIDPTPVGVRVGLGGLDASAYDHLELRLRGAALPGPAALRIGLRRPEEGGRGLVQNGSFALRAISGDWATFSIPLHSMIGIAQWTDLSELFIAVEPLPGTAPRGTYLLGEIALVRSGNPGPSAGARPPTPRKRAWRQAAKRGAGLAAARRERLAGWPRRLLVPRAELPAGNTDFLRRLARDTWRGLDALRDREHGLPLDTVSFTDSLAAPSAIGDYTNVTNVGLFLVAVVAARELDLIDADTARQRATLILDTLERLETHAGFFFNYYDTTSLERTTNFVSFIDSAWLAAGLMVVRSSFAEPGCAATPPAPAAACALAERASVLLARGDFSFFYDASQRLMSHGYFVHLGLASAYHYGLLYTESRLGSLIAIGKGDVPAAHWRQLARVFPAACDWQTQTPRAAPGAPPTHGTYEWRGLRYVPSWGGSMFEALMPALVVDEARWAPASLGENGVAHATIQRRWAEEVAHSPVWGVSPSRAPRGGYREFGVPVLGVRGYAAGVVTPHASALALAVTPDAAVANLRRLVALYDVYGDFGLYDAVDPGRGGVARDYLALDQAMLLIALANHLKPHSIQERFAADPIARRALPLLAADDFFQ